jgi:hypothetical protein
MASPLDTVSAALSFLLHASANPLECLRELFVEFEACPKVTSVAQFRRPDTREDHPNSKTTVFEISIPPKCETLTLKGCGGDRTF